MQYSVYTFGIRHQHLCYLVPRSVYVRCLSCLLLIFILVRICVRFFFLFSLLFFLCCAMTFIPHQLHVVNIKFDCLIDVAGGVFSRKPFSTPEKGKNWIQQQSLCVCRRLFRSTSSQLTHLISFMWRWVLLQCDYTTYINVIFRREMRIGRAGECTDG